MTSSILRISKKGEGILEPWMIGLIIALIVFGVVIMTLYTNPGKMMVAAITNFFNSISSPGGSGFA